MAFLQMIRYDKNIVKSSFSINKRIYFRSYSPTYSFISFIFNFLIYIIKSIKKCK